MIVCPRKSLISTNHVLLGKGRVFVKVALVAFNTKYCLLFQSNLSVAGTQGSVQNDRSAQKLHVSMQSTPQATYHIGRGSGGDSLTYILDNTPQAIAASTPHVSITMEAPTGSPAPDYRVGRYGRRYSRGNRMTPTLPSISEHTPLEIDCTNESDTVFFNSPVEQRLHHSIGVDKAGVKCALTVHNNASYMSYMVEDKNNKSNSGLDIPVIIISEEASNLAKGHYTMDSPFLNNAIFQSLEKKRIEFPMKTSFEFPMKTPLKTHKGEDSPIYFTPPEQTSDANENIENIPLGGVTAASNVASEDAEASLKGNYGNHVLKEINPIVTWDAVRRQKERNCRHQIAANELGMTLTEYKVYRKKRLVKQHQKMKKYYSEGKLSKLASLGDAEMNPLKQTVKRELDWQNKKSHSLTSLPSNQSLSTMSSLLSTRLPSCGCNENFELEDIHLREVSYL